MKQVRKLTIMGLLMLFAAMLFACGGDSETSDSSGTSDNGGTSKSSENGSSANGDPIKIGVIGAFSGESMDMGITMRNGIEMAVEEFNESGGLDGRMIEIIAYDDEANPTKATTGAQKLIDQDEVTIILGNPNTATAIATANVSRKKQVPQIVPIAQSPEVLEPETPWVFRISATNPMDIEALLNYIKEQGWEKIGLLYDTSAYGLSGYEIFIKAIPEAGLDIVAEEGYTVGAVDLTPQALNLMKADVDVVLTWGLGADIGNFVNAVARTDWDVPILGGRGTTFAIFTEVGGENADGTIATGQFDFTKPAAKEFMDKYQVKYGSVGSIDFAALGYDAANVFIEAAKAVGAENAHDRQAIRDAISQITGFVTVTGPEGSTVNFGEGNYEGASPESVVLLVHENGGWVPLK